MKFTIIMGAPCTGKTTKYAEVFDRINGEYDSVVVTTEHINRKTGKLKYKDMGFYFPEINLLFIGSHNKRGELQGLDVITNSSGLSMDEFDAFLKEHNDTNIFTEANYAFSPARRMPDNIHTLGFTNCQWVLLKHKDKQVLIDRKTARADAAGRPTTQKSIDNAWRDNGGAGRLYERFVEQAQPQDSIRPYGSETEYDITNGDLL